LRKQSSGWIDGCTSRTENILKYGPCCSLWADTKGLFLSVCCYLEKELYNIAWNFFFFFKDFIYLFGRQRHSEKGNISRGSGRGRSRLPAEQGAPQIPGPWDHHLS